MSPGSGKAFAGVRPVWALTPLEGVGPLRFGMGEREAEAALPGFPEPRRFRADPWRQEVVGLQWGAGVREPAVYGYFDGGGRLLCVAVDAVRGPRLTLDGTELAGQDPAGLERRLFALPASLGGVSYGPLGNPGMNDLGLVLRVQDTPAGLASRPVLVAREWADRCVDDSEGPIPYCEWLGPQWPHPSLPGHRVWPPAGEEPAWAGRWAPPF